MVNTKEYSEAAVEVLDIIKHMDDDQIELIPLDFIKKLNIKKSNTYKSNIDFTKPLKDNNLRNSTKNILALIYRDYLCTKEEKEELNELLRESEKIRQEKYSKDLFLKSNQKIEDNHKEDFRLVPVEKKKSFFQKILEKIIKLK